MQSGLGGGAAHDLASAADSAVARQIQVELIGQLIRGFAEKSRARIGNVGDVTFDRVLTFADIDPARGVHGLAAVLALFSAAVLARIVFRHQSSGRAPCQRTDSGSPTSASLARRGSNPP